MVSNPLVVIWVYICVVFVPAFALTTLVYTVYRFRFLINEWHKGCLSICKTCPCTYEENFKALAPITSASFSKAGLSLTFIPLTSVVGFTRPCACCTTWPNS